MDREFKRLKRLIIVSWGLLLLILISAVIYGSYELRKLKSEIAIIPTHTETIIEKPALATQVEPLQGLQGPKGDPAPIVPGPKGEAGSDGQPGPAGPVGKDGKDGEDGKDAPPAREIELGKNAQGTTVWRYKGTDIWQIPESVE